MKDEQRFQKIPFKSFLSIKLFFEFPLKDNLLGKFIFLNKMQ